MSGSKIIAAREALLPALALAGKAVARNSTIPILQNLLIAAADGTLSLTGSDLDAEILATCACNSDIQTSFTLPAATLHDAVRKLPDGAEVSIEVDGANATVASGRSRFRLPLLPAGDFPLISAGQFPCNFSLSAELLGGMVASVGFAISSEETRYYLNGIHWHPLDGVVMAVATDGHRLAKMPLPPASGSVAELPPIIVPRRTVNLLKFILDEGEIEVKASATRICFSAEIGKPGGRVVLTSKLIDGTFPDYRRVVPEGNANQFRVGRAELMASVDRVTTIGVRGGAVRFGFGNDRSDSDLRLSAHNPDAGSADEALAVERLAGAPVEIGFNGRYCLDMLNATEAKALTFHLGDAGEPALVTPSEGEARFVLMPMRV